MVDLVSRKPKATISDVDGPDTAHIVALEYHPADDEPAREEEARLPEQTTSLEPREEIESPAPVASPKPQAETIDTAKAEIDINTAAQGTSFSPEEISTNGAAPAAILSGASKVAAEKPAKAQRKPPAAAVKEPGVISTFEEVPAVVASPTTLVEEMVGLDIEIAALRYALAGKLREQNAQLRKMLARFERY
ncbi:hypothetical protein [Neorhizobium alkalisoli]|uniref:hypothetical protein n=1 Tax=Neorhizobium alkalisoli TaxID=528178 RepID=UPI0011A4B4ED|nr:hypothetical protein [Neorhizobium alkalisoli]